MNPPKPPSRAGRVPLRHYLRLFRQDMLSAQSEKLYRAWMAEFSTPFFKSFLINEPKLVKTVLNERPGDFPKSSWMRSGLEPLLGDGIFLTNGETWRRQRRIIDPAFEGGRLKQTFPAMWAAAEACVARIHDWHEKPVDFEEPAAHAAADVICRTLFSIPIENQDASQVYNGFRRYQQTQPLVNLRAILPLPRWLAYRPSTRAGAKAIRTVIAKLCEDRQLAIAQGRAPDDLATKIMTTEDPETGECFQTSEMIDQVAVFFLAGHETSASALAWALYLLATHPQAQAKVAEEARMIDTENPSFSMLSKLAFTRDVFRETLRLYPPVPMFVRETVRKEHFRNRILPKRAQVVLSPWHIHRQSRLWDNPDAFDPARWHSENGKTCARDAYIPFSSGPRVCPGAGFALAEGVLLLARILRDFDVTPAGPTPQPSAHLTVRSKNGIWLKFSARR